MSQPACDVLVIGGGPTGSTAAALLSARGYRTVLLEKDKHPRNTVGESIIPHFWKYADLSGASARLEADAFVEKCGGTVLWHGALRQMAFKDFGYTRPALHVERDRFDHLLLSHARAQGVEVVENTQARAVSWESDGHLKVSFKPKGETHIDHIRSRFVVDASGQDALLARQLGGREVDEAFRAISLWGYFRDARYVASGGRVLAAAHLRESPPTTFVTSVSEWGWAWHIPLRDTTSVGFVLPTQEAKSGRRKSPQRKFLELCETTPVLNRLLETATYLEGSTRVIRDYSYRPSRVSGPGYFVCGDAAAFVDPIFSVGVTLGMYSAVLAAWAIHRSLTKPSAAADARAIFDAQWRERQDLSRALALPGVAQDADSRDRVKRSLGFHGSSELDLMALVSLLTNRSTNYLELNGDDQERRSRGKYTRLAALEF